MVLHNRRSTGTSDQTEQADAADLLSRPARSIARRPGLPTGRAVIGALLVSFAVVGLFVSYRRAQGGPTTSYVVVTSRVDTGARIDASDLTARKLDLTADVAALAVTDLEHAVGAVALAPLLPGQLLQDQAILAVGLADPAAPDPPEVFEVSFAIDRSRALGGAFKAGERVDVVSTIADGADASSWSEALESYEPRAAAPRGSHPTRRRSRSPSPSPRAPMCSVQSMPPTGATPPSSAAREPARPRWRAPSAGAPSSTPPPRHGRRADDGR